MREILFRGKRADGGGWVYGYFFTEIGSFIKERPSSVSTNTYLVLPETVGQYTGQNDRNGTRVFEGDIVQQNDEVGTVHYEGNYCTFAVILKRNADLFQHIEYECEVVGNIFDK